MSKKLFLTLSLFVSAVTSCNDTQQTTPTITDSAYQKCIELRRRGYDDKATQCFDFLREDEKHTNSMQAIIGTAVILTGKKLIQVMAYGNASLDVFDLAFIGDIVANAITHAENSSIKNNAQLEKELLSLNLDQNSAKNK